MSVENSYHGATYPVGRLPETLRTDHPLCPRADVAPEAETWGAPIRCVTERLGDERKVW
jgi:hypothetical protein